MTTPEYAKRMQLKKLDYINDIQLYSDNKLVFNAKTSYYLSKHPIMKFRYISHNDTNLTLVYQDNHAKKAKKSIQINPATRTIELVKIEKNSSHAKHYKLKEKVLIDRYGEVEVIEEGIKLTAPSVASNGGAVPINIRSNIDAKTVSLFAKEEGYKLKFIAQWISTPYTIIDYGIKIKLYSNYDDEYGSYTPDYNDNIIVVIESKDAHFYIAKKSVVVAIGGGN